MICTLEFLIESLIYLFFIPKKDQCSHCEAYKNADEVQKVMLDEDYQLHLHEKELSRIEKENDKIFASNDANKTIIACYDLQAVLPTPRGEVSVFYYKSKLSTFNFTISNIVKSSTYCYVWHEGEAHRGVNEIGSCVLRYLSTECDDQNVVFYSDNCAGQNKNKFMVSLYLYAIAKLNIHSITHKFLVVGHTQNEGDSAHSVIEKQITKTLKSGPIYIPSQYVTLIQIAKKTGKPFNVEQLSSEDIYDIKDISEHIGYNYTLNTNGEKVYWNNIRIVKVEKSHPGIIFYKNTYEDGEFMKININNIKKKEEDHQSIKLII